MKREKVLVIGDSLSLAREELKFNDTWLSKLENKLFNKYQFIGIQRRGLTTKILSMQDTLEYISPDIIIIQLGIVDCAPRLLWFYEEQIISRLPFFISKRYIQFIKLFRNRNIKRRYVSKEKFNLLLKDYIKRAKDIKVKKIILTPIPEPSTILLNKNSMIKDSIKEYNNILQNFEDNILVFCVEQLSEKRHGDIFLDDGYHINLTGHKFLATIFNKEIQ